MVNFGSLAAEIGSLVWGSPVNFNGFCLLAALLHGILVVGIRPNFAALNRGRHLYSAGRPSHSALAHILVITFSITVPCGTVSFQRTLIPRDAAMLARSWES